MKKVLRNLISSEEANKTLLPHYELIVKSVNDGFMKYLKVMQSRNNDSSSFTDYSNRTKATMLNDDITEQIKINFIGSKDIYSCGLINKLFCLHIGKTLIRFNKKSDSKFKISNKSSEQAKAYHGQLLINGFPDEPTLLYLYYEVDKSYTTIDNIYLVCRKKNETIWLIDVNSKITDEQSVFNFGLVEDSLPELKLNLRVKPKIKKHTDE
jgi:hypothetical protein